MYGTETETTFADCRKTFENDVKMYGTETSIERLNKQSGLRMM